MMIAILSYQYWCLGSYLNWLWVTPIYSLDKQYNIFTHHNVVNPLIIHRT